MPESKIHYDGVNEMEERLKALGCACVRHGDVGGARPDLACACNEPITLVEVETDTSFKSTHSIKQMYLINQYSGKNNARSAVLVTNGKEFCGLPINSGGEELIITIDIPKCPVEPATNVRYPRSYPLSGDKPHLET